MTTAVLLAFGKDQAGTTLAILGGVVIAFVLIALVLRWRGWSP
mgnify:CR=1 FL=1